MITVSLILEQAKDLSREELLELYYGLEKIKKESDYSLAKTESLYEFAQRTNKEIEKYWSKNKKYQAYSSDNK